MNHQSPHPSAPVAPPLTAPTSAADARHEELRALLADALIRIEQLEESVDRIMADDSAGLMTAYMAGHHDARRAQSAVHNVNNVRPAHTTPNLLP